MLIPLAVVSTIDKAESFV